MSGYLTRWGGESVDTVVTLNTFILFKKRLRGLFQCNCGKKTGWASRRRGLSDNLLVGAIERIVTTLGKKDGLYLF